MTGSTQGRTPLDDLLHKHPVWVFDCDGVILDSNRIKTDAFHSCTAAKYGESAARELVNYHVKNGGISRFKKFEWFLKEVLKKDFEPSEHETLCLSYGEEVKSKLLEASYTKGFLNVLDRLNTSGKHVYVVSGGFQDELRDVFETRGLSNKFTAIYGSPTDKLSILQSLKDQGIALEKGIFFGDAKADFTAALSQNMTFVFVTGYSEALDWLKTYQMEHAHDAAKTFQTIHDFSELLA